MDCGCNSERIPMSTKSCRSFTPSFVFPLMFSKVPTTLSHTFFSTCITSMQCRTSSLHQYGRLKNIDRFFQMFFSTVFFLCFPNTISMFLTWLYTSSPLRGLDTTSSSGLPLNAFFNLR
ncbi:hypothetical protein VIGAN_05235700 [Vigna angularis var. angularis]|uniref:Uncharacterized protein n=1 Tax=Vigna angularis var. angularis TaxID=157739 RepID=A0A0S3S7H6_PHAAN|nr:hypothetical protein VIGAN_05235700 [Vigna angularis var. angularis]